MKHFLAVLQYYVREHLEEGVRCPVCFQFCKRYNRSINSAQAYNLIKLYRHYGRNTFNLSQARRELGLNACREETKARWWALLEEVRHVLPNGNVQVGYRFTDFGARYVKDEVRIPKYAHVYNNECESLDGPRVGIKDAVRNKFDYYELMGWSRP